MPPLPTKPPPPGRPVAVPPPHLRHMGGPPRLLTPKAVGGPPQPPDLETYAEAGDVVEWFPAADENEPPQTGVVTQTGLDTKVAVNVLSPYLAYAVVQDGAYHLKHPKARLDAGPGGWRHKPLTVAVRRFLLAQKILAWNDDYSQLVPAPAAEPPAEPPKPAA